MYFRVDRLARDFVRALSLCALVAAAMPAAAQAPGEVKVVRIATGPTDSTDFPFGGLVGNAISNPPGSRDCDRGGNCGVPGLIAVAQTTGGTLDNLRAVAKGEIELGLTQADIAEWAFHGVGEFAEDKPLTELRLVAQLYPATIHLIVRKDSAIKSITDLAGKKVSIGGPGSGTQFTAKQILSAHKVRWNTLQMRNLDLDAATDALKKGEIDAMFVVGGAPVLALADLARETLIDVVPIVGPTAEKLTQVLPYYTPDVIPVGTYGNDVEIPTLAVGSILVANANFDEERTFGIARAIWHERNTELFATGHPRGRLMKKALAVKGLTLPVHPGAARYYIAENVMQPAPAIAPAEPSQPLPAKPAAVARPARAPAAKPPAAEPAAATAPASSPQVVAPPVPVEPVTAPVHATGGPNT